MVFHLFNITENFLHHGEIHLSKAGSFLLGQNFVSHFNESFWHDENVSIESNLQILNPRNFSASNPNHIDVSDTQDINVFINDESILYNLSSSLKGAEATCVEIAGEMKKCFKLKDKLNFNILWNF